MAAVIGRAVELEAIERFLDALADGFAVLVLEGEPGIGKTTLVRAGISGVLIGGVIQYRLEDKRTAREDRLDQARADREEGRELDRERRAVNARSAAWSAHFASRREEVRQRAERSRPGLARPVAHV